MTKDKMASPMNSDHLKIIKISNIQNAWNAKKNRWLLFQSITENKNHHIKKLLSDFFFDQLSASFGLDSWNH